MKRTLGMKFAVALASLGLMLQQTLVVAGDAATPTGPVAVDVALGKGGLLQGKVVNAQGKMIKGATVTVWHENQQIAKTVADDNGQFAVSGVRGGVHYVVAGQGYGVYRLWTSPTAPPAAQQSAVVVNDQIVRGQGGGDIFYDVLSSPVVWGTLGYVTGHVIGFNAGLDKGPESP